MKTEAEKDRSTLYAADSVSKSWQGKTSSEEYAFDYEVALISANKFGASLRQHRAAEVVALSQGLASALAWGFLVHSGTFCHGRRLSCVLSW